MPSRKGGLIKAEVAINWPESIDFTALNQAITNDLNNIALRVRDRAKANLLEHAARVASEGDSKGNSLREISANVRKRKRNDLVYTVSVRHNLAHLVEFGTDPHRIKPKPGNKLLVWWSRWHTGSTRAGSQTQEIYFAKVVHHPGAAARPFLRPALEEEIANLLSGSL